MQGTVSRECATEATIGAWFASGAGILSILTGIVLVAVSPSRPETRRHSGTFRASMPTPGDPEERLMSLREMLDTGLLADDEYTKRREAIINKLQGQ